MIGLDTNILVRAIQSDDPVASPIARRVLSELTEASPGRVNSVVLAEFAWTLRTRYAYGRADIAAMVEALLESPALDVGDREAVSAAVARTRKEGLDFGDALIAELNRSSGCTSTLTFDRKAARSTAFTLVA